MDKKVSGSRRTAQSPLVVATFGATFALPALLKGTSQEEEKITKKGFKVHGGNVLSLDVSRTSQHMTSQFHG
jgi:hypothetical protein